MGANDAQMAKTRQHSKQLKLFYVVLRTHVKQ